MPNLLHEFQQFEEERVTFSKSILTRYAALLQEIPPVDQAAADLVTQNANKVDPAADIAAFVLQNKTGVTPPPPIEYQPFEGPTSPAISRTATIAPVSSPSPRVSVQPTQPSNFKVGTYQAASRESVLQKEWGLSAGDQALAPDQKRQKLEQQLTEIEGLLKIEITTKSGVEKLVQFYATDPAAQRKAEDELADAERKIKALQDGKRVVRKQLSELGVDTGDNDEGYGEGAGNNTQATQPAKARALFDYAATCDTELSFAEGDILAITDQDDSGWWYAELNGKVGFIPKNYVELTG